MTVFLLGIWSASVLAQDSKAFEGVYEMDLPEKVGVPAPTVLNRLTCKDGTCAFSARKDMQAKFEMRGAVSPEIHGAARYALKYAMDRKNEAKTEAPHLAPLLDSGANLAACIDLGMKDLPDAGMVILCKLDRDPWKVPAVLLMGAFLSDSCRPAMCRYELIPLLRK